MLFSLGLLFLSFAYFVGFLFACLFNYSERERQRLSCLGKEVEKIWKELREGKYDQNTLHEKYLVKNNFKK